MDFDKGLVSASGRKAFICAGSNERSKVCFLFRAASRSHVAASERWMMFSSSSFSSFIIPPQTLGSGAHRKLIPLSVLLFLRAEHLHIKRNTPAIFRSPLLTRHSYCHGNKDLGLCREASESRVTNIFRCLNSVRREIQPFVLRNDDFRVPNMHFFFSFFIFPCILCIRFSQLRASLCRSRISEFAAQYFSTSFVFRAPSISVMNMRVKIPTLSCYIENTKRQEQPPPPSVT